MIGQVGNGEVGLWFQDMGKLMSRAKYSRAQERKKWRAIFLCVSGFLLVLLESESSPFFSLYLGKGKRQILLFRVLYFAGGVGGPTMELKEWAHWELANAVAPGRLQRKRSARQPNHSQGHAFTRFKQVNPNELNCMNEWILLHKQTNNETYTTRTWSNVPIRAGYCRHALWCSIVLQELGQTEVRYMSLEVWVEQNVVGLDVPMNYERGAVMVQIAKPFGGFYGYLQPGSPF